MYPINRVVFLAIFLFSTNSVSGAPENSVYIDGGSSQYGVILAHGKGKHPTWLVVEPLRKGINDELGFHTLSLQMPKGYRHWKEYAEGFPAAYEQFKQSIRFLKKEKGVTKVFIIGHSMGSRMASSYVSQHGNHGLTGLVVAGCRNNGGYPLSCAQNLESVDMPILDIWGGKNGKDYNAASERSSLVSESYTQIEISGANHKFEGYEDELVEAVTNWLKKYK